MRHMPMAVSCALMIGIAGAISARAGADMVADSYQEVLVMQVVAETP